MTSVIITGATSLIGIAYIKELVKSNYQVTAVIRPGSRRSEILHMEFRGINVVECDISDLATLKKILSSNKISNYEIFCHIAWSSDFVNPRYNFDGQMRNVDYLADAIMAASELGCTKFLAVGSQAECGLVNKPLNSKIPDNPMTAYAMAKCEAYRCGCKLSKDLGLDFYWPRLLSAYGPYDRPSTLVMSCINSCINRTEIAMTKAEQIWDYVYVEDVARALKLIVEKGEPKKKYSIASGVGRQLVEYIKEISEVFEYPELMKGVGKREYSENEVMYLVGDVSELFDDTGMVFDTDFRVHISDMRLELQGKNQL